MRLLLAGGGTSDDEAPVNRRFASWMGQGPLLYLPIALADDDPLLESCEVWIRSILAPHGISAIETWYANDLVTRPSPADLQRFGGIYIGGGNTYRLMSRLRRTGLATDLVEYAHRGGLILGGSAGAIILGRDIATAHLVGDDDFFASEGTHGLALLVSHDVVPHYRTDLAAAVRNHVARRGHSVLALSERSGVAVDGDRLAPVGWEPYVEFQA